MTVVVLAGALANKPGNGGEAWVRLSWLLGLRGLGVETWFVEQIDAASCGAEHVGWFERVVRRFELDPRAALIDGDGRVLSGPPFEALEDACARADLLLNVSGNLAFAPLLALPRRRAYLDLDPGYTQLWHGQGALGDALDRHEELLSVGLALGTDACPLPLGGRRWRTVPPPVPLDEWPVASEPPARGFTTVASWRGAYGRPVWEGRSYGLKAHEFRRFASLPQRTGLPFALALDIHPADAHDADRLRVAGWRLLDPCVAGDIEGFRRFVRRSGAEFSAAQGVYVETWSGWFSDRTVRYLACGRPALVQDTGFSEHLPVGDGLLSFRTLEEARAGAHAIVADYERHRSAARRLAERCFAPAAALAPLLEATGVAP